VLRDRAAALSIRCVESPPRGECTLVIGGATEEEMAEETSWADEDVDALIHSELASGSSVKDLASRLALRTGRPKRSIYSRALALRGKGSVS